MKLRRFLLRRKAMANLDNILKSRGIIFLTKVHIVKAMFFSAVMYKCKRCTIKKAECWRIAFNLQCWRRLSRVPWTARRLNQSILKEINAEYSLENWYWSWSSNTLGTWCRVSSLEKNLMLRKIKGRKKKGWQKIRWSDSITVSELESEQTSVDNGGQWSLPCYGPWGQKELDMI